MVTLQLTEGQYVSFCIFYKLAAVNQSIQNYPQACDAGGLSSAHGLNTLTLWQNSCTYMILQRYFSPCNISTISCSIFIILCHANATNILLLLFSETMHYSRKMKIFLRVLISNTRSNMHFYYVFSIVYKVPFQAFRPVLMPTSYPIITRTFQASF